jgi:NTE family protein
MKKLILALLAVSTTAGAGAAPVLPSHVSRERFETEIAWKKFKDSAPEERPHVILVMGGGGARGLSHIGVLRAFEEEGIPIDEIVGVSVGALIGSLYAAGKSVDEIERMAAEIGWNKLTNVSRSAFVKLFFSNELLSTKRMEQYLKRQIGDRRFSELRIPFTCAATDIRTGERVIFREGPVAPAARASATIPGIFQPVEFRQRFLVDGGLVGNLPTDVIEAGSKEVFIVGVIPTAEEALVEEPTVLKALVRTIDIQKDVISDARKNNTDFVIEPNVGRVSLIDLDHSNDCIEAGTLATRKAALELKGKLLARFRGMKLGAPEAR